MTQIPTIQQTFEEIVRGHLGDERVNSVWVERSFNSDGDAILRVFVVYDGGKRSLTAEEMQGITSDLWDQSAKSGQSDLIVPSFMSADDASNIRSA